ncbi:hypothetical protein BAE46_03860 [Glaciecola punicea]|uniref:hypothetical protein n=1 Tax=Glaciecola punicea TaxID=56804 RepID=UPI000871D18D|nr:hypothetical protein [Glaciecola punicea]OFA32889.1 hypothetical protein BAE46_03860 [Glaciecola punicea]
MSSENNKADAQIQAHRKQHQQQKTKLFGGAGIVAAITLVSIVLYYVLSAEPAEKIDAEIIQAEVSMSQADMAALREAFKQALIQYELNVQPSINEIIMMTDFRANKVSELALIKDQALTAFAQGAFVQSTQIIEELAQKSTILINAWQAQIALHVSNGQQAFSNDEMAQAQLQVNKALALSPSNIKAMALENRIYAFGEASKLMQELKIAVSENNWPKQVAVITDIIEIDPLRGELAQTLANAQAQHDKQQLAKYLGQAAQALRANALNKAQQLVSQAQAIEPNSKGAQALSAQIYQARAQQSLTATKKSIKSAAQNDDWTQVSALVSSTLAKHPSDTDLQNYRSQAQQVLSAKQSLAPFFAAPKRLADDNIREAASSAVQTAFLASLLSPSLQQQIENVAKSIDEYNKPVEVRINSDGLTYITVVGVGHVGEHAQKIISLNPGKYVLQGQRQGYRNKRLEFTVDANTPISLTLICDERI